MNRNPRTSVPLSDGKVLIVAEQTGRKAIAVYEERGWRKTGYVVLTERQRRLLVDALQPEDA